MVMWGEYMNMDLGNRRNIKTNKALEKEREEKIENRWSISEQLRETIIVELVLNEEMYVWVETSVIMPNS